MTSITITLLVQPQEPNLFFIPSNPSLSLSLDQEHSQCNYNPLQKLGSNLFIQNGFSAFTIYDPQKNKSEQTQYYEKEPDSLIGEHPSYSIQPNELKSKKTQRQKRELNRLQTKNLNRFFRSKINEMLRDIKDCPDNKRDQQKAEQLLNILNESNKIMFSQMRQVIKDEWLQQKLTKCTSTLLRYVHKGKMGMSSKLVMLKYFNKILKAIRNPDYFTCWK